MTLPERFSYSFVEIAELLVKKADLHEGHWGLYVEFGLNATNIVTEAPKTMLPALVSGCGKGKSTPSTQIERVAVERARGSIPRLGGLRNHVHIFNRYVRFY
jgi:hypothetical protein